MENLRPNEQRAKNAITLIWIVLALDIMSLISGYLQYGLLQGVSKGGIISTETATANDTREQVISIVSMIVYIISATTFIQWFRRAYFNLHQKVRFLSHSEGWAAGFWFIPIVNLFRPYQITKELYLETKELFIKKGINVNFNFATGILDWWWTLWIINNLMGHFVFQYAKHAESMGELINSTVASMIGNIVGIPLALITIKWIKDYSSVEPLLYEIRDEEEIIIPENGLAVIS